MTYVETNTTQHLSLLSLTQHYLQTNSITKTINLLIRCNDTPLLHSRKRKLSKKKKATNSITCRASKKTTKCSINAVLVPLFLISLLVKTNPSSYSEVTIQEKCKRNSLNHIHILFCLTFSLTLQIFLEWLEACEIQGCLC